MEYKKYVLQTAKAGGMVKASICAGLETVTLVIEKLKMRDAAGKNITSHMLKYFEIIYFLFDASK
tara:strand:+ start:403 stop:597 length:195 start_codon:yes stop_codon:yes gene_type:complete